MLRGAGSVVALTTALYFTRNVLWGVISVAIAWLLALVLFDAPRGRRFLPAPQSKSWIDTWSVLRPHFDFNRQWALTRIAWPLGIVTTLGSLNMNVPRYFVESAMGETKLGVFSTMAYAMAAMATVVDSMTHSSTPKLARLYVNGKWKRFRALLFQFAALGLALGVIATIITRLAGAQVLTFLYGRTYAEYSNVFVWLTASAAISAVAMLLTNGLLSARRFRLQVPMFAVVVISNAVACAFLVPRFGLMGAARAPMIASTVHLIIAAILVTHLLSSAKVETSYPDSWEAGGL
jgi:O-antigen/teichoic acid export membrane protein